MQQFKGELVRCSGNWMMKPNSAYDPDGNREFAEVITQFKHRLGYGVSRPVLPLGLLSPKENPSTSTISGMSPPQCKGGCGMAPDTDLKCHTCSANLTAAGSGTATPQDQEVAKMMNAYWANFAKTGNPNGEGLPEWPVYNTHNEEILDIQPDGKLVGKPDPGKRDWM